MDQDIGGGVDQGIGGAEEPAKGGVPKWLWIVLAVVIGGGLLCCGGSYFFGKNALEKIGNVAGDQVALELADYPAIEEHIGTITESSVDFIESAKEKQARGNTLDYLVVMLTGSKGSGKAIVQFNQSGAQDGQMVVSGELVVNGETYPLEK